MFAKAYSTRVPILALFAVAGLLGTAAVGIHADERKPTNEALVLRQGLVISSVGVYGRSAIHTDAIESEIIHGKRTAPKEGDEIKLPDGSVRKWESMSAGDDGNMNHPALGGGYAYFSVPSESERVMVLEAAGHSTVYVNGIPRTGDPYSHGYVRLPIALNAGANDLLFLVGRGRLNAKLVSPKATAFLDLSDVTVPDLLAGQPYDSWAGVVVVNASNEPLTNVTITARLLSGALTDQPQVSAVPVVPPLGTRKVAVRLAGSGATQGESELELVLHRGSPTAPNSKLDSQPNETAAQGLTLLDRAQVKLRVLRPEQTHKRTFLSQVDGSVQYFALVPEKLPAGDSTRKGTHADAGSSNGSSLEAKVSRSKPGLVVTFHGAGVEAIGQAACFSPKEGFITVAPTNRRSFGFDWEDWGRLDAVEVMDLVEREFGTDPRRTYLTGHSMGGHGTWHVGAIYPSRFAAIGPSAGWISMYSYAGARRPENPNRMQEMLLRAAAASDTLALVRNYGQHGVYILHGDQDDNVPVDQARAMRQKLAEFHPDFVYREQPGAGHWWGDPCVDWAPMVDFFRLHSLPERKGIHKIDFTTISPGVSAWSHWVSIDAQLHSLAPSSVKVNYDTSKRKFSGSTENVARLVLDLGHLEPEQPLQIELDGDSLADVPWPEATGDSPPASANRIWLERRENHWELAHRPGAARKSALRYGPFKEAFRNHMLFVFGTQGTPEENAWSRNKARLDAERFWYQGNGSVDVISDQEFVARNSDPRSNDPPAVDRKRNVILYGNSDTHAAWPQLLGSSPVQVKRGIIQIGERSIAGEDLACLFVRPRPDSDQALVGVVTGSGIVGMRLTDRLPYFVSGIGYPDYLVVGADMLTRGIEGVRTAGFFGVDWGVPTGDFEWRE